MADLYVNVNGASDRLVVLADDGIVTANPDPSMLAGGGAEALAAAALATGNRIPYAAIQSIKANRFRDDVNIQYRDGSASRLTNIGFKDTTDRDRAVRAIHKRLGPQFRLREEQYSAGRAALAPMVTLLAVAGFTYLSVLAASEIAGGAVAEVRGRNQLMKSLYVWVLQTLGPTGVMIAGALIALGAVAWLVQRVKQPPRMVTIAAQAH